MTHHLHKIGLFFSQKETMNIFRSLIDKTDFLPTDLTTDHIKKLQIFDTCLLITDHQMSARYEDQLIRLKAASSKGLLPILVVVPPTQDASPILEAGYDDILRMPITSTELRARLNVFARLHHQSRQLAARGEAIFQTLIEQSLTGVFLVTREEFIYFNQAFADIFAIPHQEFLSEKSIIDFISESDQPRIQTAFENLFEGKEQSERLEFTGIKESGEPVFCEMFIRIIDFKGESAVLGIILDNSERKKVEQELKESEERYRLLVETVPDFIVAHDLEGNILFCNKACIKASGYTKEEIYGRKIFDFLPADEMKTLMERKQRRQQKDSSLFQYETRFIAKDGSSFAVEVTSAPLIKGGTISAIYLIARDVRIRKQAEQAIRVAAKKYRSFFENDLTGDFISRPDGTIVDANPALARMFGFKSVQELLQVNAYSLWRSREDRKRMLEELIQKGKLEQYQLEFVRKDGKPLFVIGNYIAKFDEEGNLTEIQGYLFDITERRNLERQLRQAQKMEAIGRLTGGIAHDFNNMLSVINGYATLLSNEFEPEDPKRKDLVEILKASDRAAALTRQLLAFSRKQILNPVNLNLNQLVANLEKMLRRLIGEDIELQTFLSEDLDTVYADPTQIEQIILNLAVNARDAMPEGGKLTIETQNVYLDKAYQKKHIVVQPGHYVMLAVSDTGVGMDKDTQERIFEPFFTTKEKGKGTGLGLSTVYGIVKQSEGFIWVYSEPGQGTTFKIYLPRIVKSADPLATRDEQSVNLQGNENILLVEDDKDVRNILERFLTRYGYHVTTARLGDEALKFAQDQPNHFDLLLTDVVLPGMSGKQIADSIQPFQKGIKVLYMSGYTDNVITSRQVLKPGIEFIAKPFSPTALARKVREILDKGK